MIPSSVLACSRACMAAADQRAGSEEINKQPKTKIRS